MSPEVPTTAKTFSADVNLRIGERRLHAKVSVPAGPTRLVDLLPFVQRLADSMVEVAVEHVLEQGESISCKKGCGACCRQLVPISQVEARRIRELIEEMPEPRRSQVRARFAQAKEQLQESGLYETLGRREQWAPESVERIGMDYFRAGIACPFLEDESCSIHPDRPITCREYLVTSPAEHCARPTRETVASARIPLKVWPALARFDKLPPGDRYISWVPLVLAPEWADVHPDEAPARPGPKLLQELFQHLSGKDVPAPPVGLGG
jgi:Fe-S-cluster containining protein